MPCFGQWVLFLSSAAGLWLASCNGKEPQQFSLDRIPRGQWIKIPTLGEAAPKVFHGGAAISASRGEVYFFGSDTHAPTALENGESNSLWRLNLRTLTWSRDYEQDPKSAWRILPDSQTVTTAGRPWAMHTFDAVEYDPVAHRVVVVSYPQHARFEPEERFPMFKGEWYKSLKPSHWEYDPDSRSWVLLATAGAPDLFAKALTWDSDRKLLLAVDGNRTWHFDRETGRWIDENASGTPSGWHLSMVYDTFDKCALLLGHNGGSDTLYAYSAPEKKWSAIPATGRPLPANGAAMAYDTRNCVLLYLANDYPDQYNNPTGKSVTFIYHSGRKTWERLEVQSPELYGMNYLMQYDRAHDIFLHFEKSLETGDYLQVWAFRYK